MSKKPALKYSSKPRNFVAQNPLLRKGGVHQKSNKAQRARSKQELRAKVRDSFSLCAQLLIVLLIKH